MNKKVIELLTFMKNDEKRDDEYVESSYKALSQNPIEFCRDLLLISKNSLCPHIIDSALSCLDRIVREYTSNFDGEYDEEKQKEIFAFFQTLVSSYYNTPKNLALHLFAGYRREHSNIYVKLYQKETKNKDIFIKETLNGIEESLLDKAMLKYKETFFNIIEKTLKQPITEEGVQSLIYISAYVNKYPMQIDSVQKFFPAIISLVKSSAKLQIEVFQQLWFVLSQLLAYAVPYEEFHDEIISFIINLLEDESLSLDYKLPLIDLLVTNSNEINMDIVFKCADICNSIIVKHYTEVTESLSTNIHNFYCSLYENFNFTDVIAFMKAKITGNFASDDENAIAANIYLTRSMLIYTPTFFLSDWSYIEKITDFILSKSNTTLIKCFCMMIMDIPEFIGSNSSKIDDLITKMIKLIDFEQKDAIFITLYAIIYLFNISVTVTKGNPNVLFDKYDKIPNSCVGVFLETLAESIRTDGVLSIDYIHKIVEIIEPMLNNEDLSIVNASLMVCIELIKQNEEVKEKLMEQILASIKTLLHSKDPNIVLFGIERLANIINKFQDDAEKVVKEEIKVLQNTLLFKGKIEIFFKERALVSLSKIATYNENQLCMLIANISSEWITSGNEFEICAAAEMFHICYKYMPKDNAILVFNAIKNDAIEEEDVAVATYLLNITADIIEQSSKSIIKKVQSGGRSLFLNYVNGELESLNGVPPEATDINYEMLVAVTRVVIASINGKKKENESILSFYESLIKTDARQLEVYIKQTLLVWIKFIRTDSIEKEEINHIKDIIRTLFNAKSNPVYSKEVMQLIELLYQKKYILERS